MLVGNDLARGEPKLVSIRELKPPRDKKKKKIDNPAAVVKTKVNKKRLIHVESKNWQDNIKEKNNRSPSPELTVPKLEFIQEQKENKELINLVINKDQPKDGHTPSQYFCGDGILMRKRNPQKIVGKMGYDQ